MFYSGIDLHKDNVTITTVDSDGNILNQKKLPNEEYTILNYFYSIGKQHKAVVESTSNWYWLSDLLNDHGIDLTLAHAKYLKAISYAKVKTDKVDSKTLADLLRVDMIPAAHQISPSLRGLRDLMRARLKLVRKDVSCQNSIHRLLAKYNINVPEGKRLHNLPTLDMIKQLPLQPQPKMQLEMLIEQIHLLRKQTGQLRRSIYPLLIPNDDVQRLLWIPGIGRLSAFTIYLEIDGIERFPDVNRFWSYCRLVPGADNSNKKTKHKSANKDGNKYLKMAFSEASVAAVRFFKEIKEFRDAKERKKHKAIAKTLVAQELAKSTYYVLKNKTDFNNTFKGKTLSRRKAMQWPRLESPDA